MPVAYSPINRTLSKGIYLLLCCICRSLLRISKTALAADFPGTYPLEVSVETVSPTKVTNGQYPRAYRSNLSLQEVYFLREESGSRPSLHRDSLLSFDLFRLKENLGFQRCYMTSSPDEPEKSLSGNREIPKTENRFLFLNSYSRSRDNPCFLASFTVIWPFLVFRRLQEQMTSLPFDSKVRSTLNMCWNVSPISRKTRGIYSQLLQR